LGVGLRRADMKKWLPFLLWLLFFWPAVALAERSLQGVGDILFTDDGLILAIVWIILLFDLKPEKKDKDSSLDDDDEEEDVLPNATLVVRCGVGTPRDVVKELTIHEPPAVNTWIVVDSGEDADLTVRVKVDEVVRVFDGSSIEWRIQTSTNFEAEFEKLVTSGKWRFIQYS
jgi:hypothetical protein